MKNRNALRGKRSETAPPAQTAAIAACQHQQRPKRRSKLNKSKSIKKILNPKQCVGKERLPNGPIY